MNPQMTLVLLPAAILTTPDPPPPTPQEWLVTTAFLAALTAVWLTMRK